jgi:multiple antibiotic resistance protein
VLTTTLMMAGQYGTLATLLAYLVNLALAGLILWQGDRILRLVSPDGARAASKVAHLLLAAIAVMLVRKGLMVLLAH